MFFVVLIILFTVIFWLGPKIIKILNQPEKKCKISYENKTSKNCTICKVIAHGAMLFNSCSSFISPSATLIG